MGSALDFGTSLAFSHSSHWWVFTPPPPHGMPGHLPPLPPASTWRSFFPRKVFGSVGFGSEKPWVGRVTLGDTALCDAFVRGLKLRENEVVFDVLPGPGSTTRSLLSGGNSEQSTKDWLASNPPLPDNQPKIPASTPLSPFPWIKYLSSEAYAPRSRTVNVPPVSHNPRLVIALEPSSDLLVRGLGMDLDFAQQTSRQLNKTECDVDAAQMYTSPLEPRLKMLTGNPYFWNVVPGVLQHPDIAADLVAAGAIDGSEKNEEEAIRQWKGDAPHITLVAQFPHKNLGEQLVAQWLHSVIGAAEGQPGFIWRWGRARMAMLVPKVSYDRIMAQPGELMYSKVSVLAQALFDITPIPPRHHVPNIDKGSNETRDECVLKSTQTSPRSKAVERSYIGRELPRDETCEDDFFPRAGKQGDSNKPLDRPEALGLLFEPKIQPVIKIAEREAWDHVLRHMFIKQAHRIEIAITALGFGSDKLLPRISSNSMEYAGEPVPPDTIVRDISIEQWVRIVDVFFKWQFKPEDMWVRNFMKGTKKEGAHLSW